MVLRLTILVAINFYHGYEIQAQIQESLSIASTLMDKEMAYSIYLPPDYNSSTKSYPIVYLLHGYTDNETGWTQFGQIDYLVTEAIQNGTIPPMIIAMPDAGVTWYINDHDYSNPYEDYFFQEFLPHIESKYRVRAEKQFRGVAGLSMGGYGSLLYALKHPDMFVASAPLSAAIYTREEVIQAEMDRWNRTEAVMYGKDLAGPERITQHWIDNNPIEIIKSKKVDDLKKVHYYFDCGDDDFLYKGNATTHILLRDLKIPHEFRIRDGAHNWTYWRTGIIDALDFIGKHFHR